MNTTDDQQQIEEQYDSVLKIQARLPETNVDIQGINNSIQ
jgi:hypothetical protein